MIKEEYKENKDGSEYTYKYYDKNDPDKYVIVSRGKIIDKTTEDFIDIVEKDCGSYKRKDYKIETNEDWKKITGDTRGDIDCSNTKITSLEGSPSKVGGNFYCFDTKITSLKGAPKEVGGSFYCNNSKITSLKGAPNKVGRGFYCNRTKITSLEGAPSKVGGNFYCDNTQITSLEGAPKEVGGIFYCDNTQITSLEGAPQKVGGIFYCDNTKITKDQAIEYLKNNDCNEIVGEFGTIKKSDIIKESYFNY